MPNNLLEAANADRPSSLNYPSATNQRLTVREVPVASMSPELFNDWMQILSSNPKLASPFFHPSYAKAVSRVRPDARLLVAEKGEQLLAILPIQLTKSGVAEPVGGRLNDFHGLIAAPDAEVTLPLLISLSRLKAYNFHGQIESNWTEGIVERNPSPFLDLSQGFDHFLATAKTQSSTIKRHPQKFRALIRDHGPIRLVHDIRDRNMLEHLICLKRNKYARTKAFDVFSVDWCVNLLREIYDTEEAGLRGVLSGMFAGDRLVAVHFGIQYGKVLQYWFPTFDPRFAKYSPGTQMILDVARVAADHGIEKIDLSYGPEAFRFRVGTGTSNVAKGSIDSSPLRRAVTRSRYRVTRAVKKLPIKEPIKRVVRTWMPNIGVGEYR